VHRRSSTHAVRTRHHLRMYVHTRRQHQYNQPAVLNSMDCRLARWRLSKCVFFFFGLC
jgi:hypothetical protein